jgi:hypothetical protein
MSAQDQTKHWNDGYGTRTARCGCGWTAGPYETPDAANEAYFAHRERVESGGVEA